MCNCHELPKAFGTTYWSNQFDWPGQATFPHASIEPEVAFDPALDREIQIYRCKDCGAHWYVQVDDDEYPEPTFAMRAEGGVPSEAEIEAAQHFLAITLHDGFSPDRCHAEGCPNHQLKGRYLCHVHFGTF